MKIAIDCGHTLTGADIGASGIGGKEEVRTREIGNILKAKLELLGNEVLMVACDNASTLGESLVYRVEKANNWNADLYVSIHLNAFNTEAYGVEVHVSKNASQISKDYAQKVQTELVKLGYENRGVQVTGLYVTTNTNMPAFLAECGFVDNQGDTNLYNAGNIASAICVGITGQTICTPISTPKVASIVSGTKGTVKADTLNVRSTPGGTIIGTLNKGTEVKIDKEDGDWLSIFYGDHGGYVSNRYIDIKGIAATVKVASIDRTYATVLASTLNVRDSIMGNIVGEFSQGDQVKLCRREGNWYHIYYGDKGAWVCGDYLKI